MESFARIYQRACDRKGGADVVARLLPTPAPDDAAVANLTDAACLSMITRRVFQAGFAWRVIDAKWDGFEAAFHGFDVDHCMGLTARQIEDLAADTRIVRNRQKIRSVPANARFVADIAGEHGSFGAWLAGWDARDIVGLWRVLAKRGARLGGMSAPILLRGLGKDTWQPTTDVVTVLVANRVIDGPPTSQRAQRAGQAAFNTWQDECGRPLAEISRICALSVGADAWGVAEPAPDFLLDPED